MENEGKNCGNCSFHRYDRGYDDWRCCNTESEYQEDFTGFEDSCEEWEIREQ